MDNAMISRAERKRRKARVNNAVVSAYFILKEVDGLLDFNKRLKDSASEITYRLLLLHEKLEDKGK